MRTSRGLRAAVLLAAAVAPTAAAREGRTPSECAGPDAAAYRVFAEDGRGQRIAWIAAAAYLDVAGRPVPFPAGPPGAGGRSAGPRDEPTPPEWPVAPVGVAVCAEGWRFRRCEGTGPDTGSDLAGVVTALAERLAARGISGAADGIEVLFTLEPVSTGDADRDSGPGARGAGRRIEGSGGALVLLPGDARSERGALRLARKAGVLRRGERPIAVVPVQPCPAGRVAIAPP